MDPIQFSPSELRALALPHVAKLAAYTPGLQPSEPGWVKLNTNECPYPPSPRVAEAIKREVGADGATLRLYPDPKSHGLRAAVAKLHGLKEENVCVGNGSDDLLNLLVRCFCAADAAAGFTLPSYSLYPVLVGIQGGRSNVLMFDRSMRLPVERLAASTASVFFLTSPNAPTGVGFGNVELEKVLNGFRGLLVVDEAYAPFAQENAVPLLGRHPNLVVVRTLSKAYGLAGIRVGYALAHPEVIGLLWGEGVVAEVALFLWGRRLVERIGAPGLALAAATLGLLRWSVTATTTDPLVLALVQPLHAATFGCMHLGAMRVLAADLR